MDNLLNSPGLGYLVLGVMASGGSGMWNGVLDAVRAIQKERETLRNRMERELK